MAPSRRSETESEEFEMSPHERREAAGDGLCGPRGPLPLLFAHSDGSWLNPKFFLTFLELHFKKKSFPIVRRRFLLGLVLLAASCFAWALYSVITRSSQALSFLIPLSLLSILALGVLVWIAIFDKPKHSFGLHLHIGLAVFLTVLCLIYLACCLWWQPVNTNGAISEVGHFSLYVAIIMIMYETFPIPLYLMFMLSILAAIFYEVGFYSFKFLPHPKENYTHSLVLNDTVALNQTATAIYNFDLSPTFVVMRLILHLLVVLMGFVMHLGLQVRLRTIFWKFCIGLCVERAVAKSQEEKDNMVYSLMPPDIAAQIISAYENEDTAASASRSADPHADQSDMGEHASVGSEQPAQANAIQFRPFNVNQLHNVSILYADIVGFTRMSSGKTASELVELLNDLFGRFDRICQESGCEKIATLGDCYYAVSGCPNSRPDHAQCCCELGLRMIDVIRQFDEDRNEQVNMRVGVHTGSVLMGIVGTKRFKFDVWSNDVTLANEMESTGRAGCVHISADTYELVKDLYDFEKGEEVEDARIDRTLHEHYDPQKSAFVVRQHETDRLIQTYFITNRKQSPSAAASGGTSDGKLHHDGDATPDQPLLGPRSKEHGAAGKRPTPSRHEGSSRTGGIDQDSYFQPGDNTTRQLGPSDVQRQDSAAIPNTPNMSKMDLLAFLLRKRDDKSLDEKDCHLPVNPLTLAFKEARIERLYRGSHDDIETHLTDSMRDEPRPGVQPLPTGPNCSQIRHGLLVDASVAVGFTLLLGASLLLVVPASACLLVLLAATLLTSGGALALGAVSALRGGTMSAALRCLPRHLLATAIVALLLSLPLVDIWAAQPDPLCFLSVQYAFLVALLHLVNFSSSTYWLKTSLATVIAVAFCVVTVIDVPLLTQRVVSVDRAHVPFSNESDWGLLHPVVWSIANRWQYEVVVATILLLIIIWILNYDAERTWRLAFHMSAQEYHSILNTERETSQTHWLLSNIMPSYALTKYIEKKQGSDKLVSDNHKEVAVIFASISNFSEFYEQSYEGGKGYIRVLNEIFADFESLLDEPRYKDIDKIKTIGACFMAASGLNMESRNRNAHPDDHLYAMMDYCLQIIRLLHNFNQSMLNFKFDIKIGYNFGEVTSGVIGSSKLHFDIWGDTVNVASRMYSTGVKNSIQVPAMVFERLQNRYEMKYRDKIQVKGKDDMHTYIVLGPKKKT